MNPTQEDQDPTQEDLNPTQGDQDPKPEDLNPAQEDQSPTPEDQDPTQEDLNPTPEGQQDSPDIPVEGNESKQVSPWVVSLRERLKNRFFVIVFGFAVGLPILFVLFLAGGPDIFTSGGGEIETRDVMIFVPVNVGFIIGVNYLAGWIKRYRGWRTNYTRKITHISNFTFLMVLTFFGGYTASFIFGLLMIGYGVIIVVLGDGNIFYEAVAREQDVPYRAFYLVVPSIATIIAVLMNRTIFGDYANLGYLVAGWGDAVGEPIGVRFGKHRYKVPTLTGIACTRSYEGSTAVFVMSSFAAAFTMEALLEVPPLLAVGAGIAAGIGAPLVEAVSPHGMDNFTIQVAAVAMAYFLVEVAIG